MSSKGTGGSNSGGGSGTTSGGGGIGNNGGNGAGAGAGTGASQQDHTSIVLEYLIKRGYHGAAQALRAEIDPSTSNLMTTNGSSSTSGSGSGAGGAGPNSASTPGSLSNSTAAGGRSVTQEVFERRNLGKKNQVREDPTPWRDGLLGLREFVYGSLDIHRPELLPILLPVYIHSYFDLQLLGYRDQAELLFQAFFSDYSSSNPEMVQLLHMLKTPSQILENERAVRWRKERYVVRMTRRGWSLLLGWLQGGVSGMGLSGSIGAGAAASAHSEIAERGREKMLGIINERVRVDVVDPKFQALQAAASGDRLVEGGLESELAIDIPISDAVGTGQNSTGNISSSSISVPQTPLKLGSMPADPKLQKEVHRVLQAEGISSSIPTGSASALLLNGTSGDSNMKDADVTVDPLHSIFVSSTQDTLPLPPLLSTDLPPYPPSFRTIDVRREVEKVREARKRIKLGPLENYQVTKQMTATSLTSVNQARYSLPSVCMFTVHDTGDT